MFSYLIIYLLVALLFMAIPCILIYKVVRKSLKKPDAAGLLKEKMQMRDQLYLKKHTLQPWSDESIALINNNINYVKWKSVTRQARGTMNTFDNSPLLVFRLIERGLTADGHMYIVSSSFDLYIKYEPSAVKFYFNDNFLGNYTRPGLISNVNGQVIGNAYRVNDYNGYYIVIKDKKLGYIQKANNLDHIHRNPSYRPFEHSIWQNKPFYKTDIVTRHDMLKLADSTYTEEEKQWLIAIALFETIYYSTYII